MLEAGIDVRHRNRPRSRDNQLVGHPFERASHARDAARNRFLPTEIPWGNGARECYLCERWETDGIRRGRLDKAGPACLRRRRRGSPVRHISRLRTKASTSRLRGSRRVSRRAAAAGPQDGHHVDAGDQRATSVAASSPGPPAPPVPMPAMTAGTMVMELPPGAFPGSASAGGAARAAPCAAAAR